MNKEDAKLFLTLYLAGHQNNPDIGVSKIDPLVVIANRVRQEHGLKNLIQKERLGNSAKAKSQDLNTQKYWAHDNPQGKTPWDFIHESGYKYNKAGENLARGYSDPETMFRAWLDSPGHRKNLLNPEYTEIGMGAEGDYTTQHFAKPPKYKAPTIKDFLTGKMK